MIFTEEGRQLDWEPVVPKPAPVVQAFVTAPAPVVIREQAPVKKVVVPGSKVPEGSRNKHPIEKTRDLTKEERSVIKTFFEANNGIIKPDSVRDLRLTMAKDLGISQVTGSVSFLHRMAMEGKYVVLRDRAAYLAWRNRPESEGLTDYRSLTRRVNLDEQPRVVHFTRRGYHR